MTSEETAKYLCKLGYSAEGSGGKIVITVPEKMWRERKNRVRNTLRSVGYKGKLGYRVIERRGHEEGVHCRKDHRHGRLP